MSALAVVRNPFERIQSGTRRARHLNRYRPELIQLEERLVPTATWTALNNSVPAVMLTSRQPDTDEHQRSASRFRNRMTAHERQPRRSALPQPGAPPVITQQASSNANPVTGTRTGLQSESLRSRRHQSDFHMVIYLSYRCQDLQQ